MATKPKEGSSTVVGNEKKKVPSSSSLPTPTKRITKPSTAIKSNSTTPSEKNIPSNLKPTTSFRQTKTETPIKPPPIRRRSFDKPLSSSNLTTKTTQPSPSRLHKALVSPGPRERSSINRSPIAPVKSINSSKPISEKTPSDAKTKQVLKKPAKKVTTPNSNIASSNTTKKVSKDHAASVNPVKIKSVTTDKDSSNVEAEDVKKVQEVQEVTNLEDEVIKVESEEHASQQNILSDVNSEIVHEHEHDNQVLEDSGTPQNQVEDDIVISTVSGTPQNQVDDEKVISTVSEEAEKESQEEKHEVEHDEKHEEKHEVKHGEKHEVEHKEKENNNGNQSEEVEHEEKENNNGNQSEEVEHEEKENSNGNQSEEVEHEEKENNNGNQSEEVEHEEKENNNGNQSEEVDHSEVEREKVVNENEQNESGIVPEDEKNETNEEQGREEKEAVEGGVSEEVEEAKAEVAKPKQQLAGGGNGKKESQVSNDMIEETASKLLGRKNKVLALAGAFQTVIDHQTK